MVDGIGGTDGTGSLTLRARRLAQTQPPEVANTLRELADNLDNAIAAQPFVIRRVMSAWTKLRMAYCRVTSDPIV